LNIRPAAAADIPAMLDLERQCFSTAHWSRQQYEDLFRPREDGPRRLVLVLDQTADGCVQHENKPGSEARPGSPFSRTPGFLIAHHLPPEWELENVVVAPAVRRTGLATKLLAALLKRARETNSERVFLEVRESNHAARALYVGLGFEESGRRKLYYANPAEDAVLYRLVLTHPSTNHPSANQRA
jgi:ribosomal protein S18 acetylase RimI-like enzyme